MVKFLFEFLGLVVVVFGVVVGLGVFSLNHPAVGAALVLLTCSLLGYFYTQKPFVTKDK
jgi:hypothetical protein